MPCLRARIGVLHPCMWPPHRSVCWIQDGSDEYDAAHAVVMADDGSVILAGVVGGEWVEEPLGGEGDFAACMLDTNMTLVWSWQVRT